MERLSPPAVPSAQELAGRWQGLRTSWEDARSLIEDLMRYCNDMEGKLRDENSVLRSRVADLSLDLEDATSARRKFQLELRDAEDKIQNLTAHINNKQDMLAISKRKFENVNPYVIALIDGDGLLFKEKYVQNGLDGGKQAARDLRNEIKEKWGTFDKNIRIEAKVFANLTGLSRAMKSDRVVTWETGVREFGIGFTQAISSFDFIDVGSGKERADSRIKELTRWHLNAPSCRHIMLGISHDSGYAPFLDEIHSGDASHRMSMIEGFPAHKALVKTGIKIINMTDSLFRDEKIINQSVVSVASATAATTFDDFVTPSPARGASPPPVIKLPIPAKSNKKATTTTVAWNPGPRGLDPPVSCTQAGLDLVKNRRDDKKLCNVYHLRQVCPRNFLECPFDHRQNVSKEELAAIAYLSRTNPCSSGQDCTNSICIYGHNCPNTKDLYCTNAYCKFTVAQHPPGTKFRNSLVPDN